MLFYAIFYNLGPRCYSMLYFTILDLDVILCYISLLYYILYYLIILNVSTTSSGHKKWRNHPKFHTINYNTQSIIKHWGPKCLNLKNTHKHTLKCSFYLNFELDHMLGFLPNHHAPYIGFDRKCDRLRAGNQEHILPLLLQSLYSPLQARNGTSHDWYLVSCTLKNTTYDDVIRYVVK